MQEEKEEKSNNNSSNAETILQVAVTIGQWIWFIWCVLALFNFRVRRELSDAEIIYLLQLAKFCSATL